ncbi:MAG: universal stress protein, partial [Propionibacteriaceae bacterium]|nr:universal stress protein [Propionibacteriaceae bacterium]
MTTGAGLHRVLVGYGGDDRSRDAVRLGAALAEAAGAELHIGLVLRAGAASGVTYPPVGDITGIITDQGRRWLAEAEELVPAGIAAQTHLVADRSVAEGMLGLIGTTSADVVVTGSGVGTGRRSLHPTVDALLHSSPVPVALSPRGFDGESPISEVLVAVAEDSPVHQVVGRGADWAAQLGVSLTPTTLRTDQERPARSEDRVTLAQTVAQEAADRCEVTAARIGVGRTVKRAVRSIDWPAGGVLLIGSSRLAGGPRTFLGATAARLVAHLPIPLVVLPRTEAATDQAA